MQVVQLYIEGQRVDLFQDENITITQTIQNVRDISKVFTDFTKTFTLPASKTNNKIFKHYYNYSIDNSFDARKKKTAKIELNTKKFRDGKIKLEGVEIKSGVPFSYRVTFYGNTIDLKDLLGEDNLSSLDWLNNFSLDYDSSTVLLALQNAGGLKTTIDGIDYKIIAPLITHTKRPYYDSNSAGVAGSMNLYPIGSTLQGLPFTELKYALPIKAIIKAIENSGYGITFSQNFFNDSNLAYSDLYMWLHRKKGEAFDSAEVTHQMKTFPTNLDELIGVACYPDKLLVFNSPQGVSYTLRVESNSTNPYTVIIKKDGQVFRTGNANGGLIHTMSGVLTNSSTGYSVFIQTNNSITQIEAEWQITSIQYPESFNYTSSLEQITLTQEFIITEQIPKIKIIDFLTGLFNLFNLTAYENEGVIEVKTLDEYYSSTESINASQTDITADSTLVTADASSALISLRDITQYVDYTNSTVDVALPFKEVSFEYEGLGTKLALQHEQTFNQGWATTNYFGEDNYDAGGDVYKVQVPFEHMKYERLLDYDNTTKTTVQVGWFVDDNDASYFGKPLLFYPVLINSLTIEEPVTNIRVLTESSYQDITQYNIPSNSLKINSEENKNNINFNLELNEYTYSDNFTDTLFEKYYKTYISEIFNAKLRLSKYKAYLPIKFLLNYSLADRVQILDRVYKINSINTNLQTGESDLELINDFAAAGYTQIEPNVLPVVTTQAETPISSSSVTLNGTVVALGDPEYTSKGFYWKLGTGDPTVANNVVELGNNGLGSFSATLTNLTGATEYSFRAFAINSEGTAYGVTQTFTTEAALAKATVITNSATSVTNTSATLNAGVIFVGNPPYVDGDKGFYYVLGTGTPTASDNVVTVSGTGTGGYSHNLTSLSENTTYSFRAFVINSQGVALGSVQPLTTSQSLFAPTVSTSSSTFSQTSATLYGFVSNVGNPTYTQKGFYLVEGSGIPTPLDTVVTVSGTLSGSYASSLITGLNSGTQYSFRAFCTNSQGTDLGATLSFTTSQFITTINLPSVNAVANATVQVFSNNSFPASANGTTGNTQCIPLGNNTDAFEYSAVYTANSGFEFTGTDNISTPQSTNPSAVTAYVSGFTTTTLTVLFTGSIKSFNTSANLIWSGSAVTDNPVSQTTAATNVTFNSATLNANVTNIGVPAYTSKGFYWVQGTSTPTNLDNVINVSGTSAGVYSSNITSLNELTTYTFVAFITNSQGTYVGSPIQLQTLRADYQPIVNTNNITNIAVNSATLNGNVTDVGQPNYTSKGFYWAVSPNEPTSANTINASGTTAGVYSAPLTGLTENTTYRVRAFATNTQGTALGQILDFNTSEQLYAPTVLSVAASNQTINSATLNGDVIDVGNPAYTTNNKGFYWIQGVGTPTSNDNLVNVSGTGTGAFSTSITGLADNSTFSFRAFCLNNQGIDLGDVLTFQTLEITFAPTVTTSAVSQITTTTATFNGNVTNVGNPNYTTKGFCYIQGTGTPTILDNPTTVAGTSAGAYVSNVSGLTDNTTYSVRAYATNSIGTSYGVTQEFSTEEITFAPIAETSIATSLTINSAALNGQITNVGNPAYTNNNRGFYWILGTGDPANGTRVNVSGTDANPYSFVLSGLSDNTTYSFKAFASNGILPDPSFGQKQTFTTIEYTYTGQVLTLDTTNILANSATFNGNITDSGNPVYTQKGFCYIQGVGTPTVADSVKIVTGTGTGVYSSNITSLVEDTTYSVRAYVTNLEGTAYGETKQFSTLPITYYTLKRCYDDTQGYTSGQKVSEISLGTNDRVQDAALNYYTVTGTTATQVNSVGTITDTSLSGCPTNLPRTYEVQECDGIVTSTINYSSDSQVIQGSAYWDGTKCWTFLSLETYNPSAPTLVTPTIYNSCFDCTVANQFAPTVLTNDATNLTEFSARLNGNLTNNGYPDVTEKGFVWITGTGIPTTLDNKQIIAGSTVGTYNYTLGTLTPETTYTYRAYAINSVDTVYGVNKEFTTPPLCEGGTLFFNSSVITGINATLQTGNISYSTSQCGSVIPTLSLLFTNNEGEWQSTSQISSIQLFEGGVDVSSQYVLGKVLNGDVMTITLNGNFPNAFNDGDHYYEFRITAFNIPFLTTTITLPSTNAVNHATRVVTKNGTTQFPASRRDDNFNNSTLYPIGLDGDAYEYTITYTADAGYLFTGLGNITLAGTTGAGVNQIQDSYTSTTYTIKVYGTIQATDITGSVNWSGSAIADPATTFTKEYRFLGQSTWEAWPAAGVDIGSGATPVEVKITPDGAWASIQGNNYTYLISSHSPTYDYTGDPIVMTVNFNTMSGADPDGSSSITITPMGSTSSIGNLRFNYFQPV